MKLATRVFLLATGVLLLAHYVPAGYWLVTARAHRPPIVYYSCIEKRFLLLRPEPGGVRRTDPAGNLYEREHFEQLLPLDNYLQLYKDNRMPAEIDGVTITPEKLRRERLNARFKPEMLDSPTVALRPLFEAESGRVRLEMPTDFMRLGRTIEFIDTRSNRVLPEKSAAFQRAFAAAGFAFPVRLTGSNPTTMKPYDEGCYLVDAHGEFFRLRQVRGAPELTRLTNHRPPEERPRWAQLQPRYIHVQEQDNRELRAIIVGADHSVHLLVGPNWRLVKLPLERFDPANMQLSLRGDLLNRLVTVTSAEYVEAVALTRDYVFLDRYTEHLPAWKDRPEGRLAATLFPFTFQLERTTSGYLGFHFQPGNRFVWALNLALLLGLTMWWRLGKRPLGDRWPELVAIGVGGIFGIMVVTLLPRTD